MGDRKVYADKRVAILAVKVPNSPPGGAERLYEGLKKAIQKEVKEVEIVSLSGDESTFCHILDNYEQWRKLDLSSFDMVISTKAPTYVIDHPCHVMYLVHTVRVFYDMFDEMYPVPNEMCLNQRKIIHEMDQIAFDKIEHRFTIGNEVSRRLKKWNKIDSNVLHPPLYNDYFVEGELGDYFFMPGRLHDWKRVDLAINAIKLSDKPLRLVISGTGEAEEKLMKLANNDPRIEFVGRLSDDELIDKYANALAILFLPIREDYGYITIEAFKSGKTVITCKDSGEPLHFIKDGKTGIVCEPNPESVMHAMENLFYNRSLAKDLGKAGKVSISHINWENVSNQLLSAGFDGKSIIKTEQINAKTKVAILDMQPIDPPVGGGRLRLLGLYHGLGENIEAKYIGTYDWPGERFRQHMLSKNLEEINVPLSNEHFAEAEKLSKKADGKVVIDVSFSKLGHLSPDYIKYANNAIEWADVVIFSHPWVFTLVEKKLKNKQLVIYDSHNVEGYLRAQLFNQRNPAEAAIVKDVVSVEYSLGKRSDMILACSEEDINMFNKIYDFDLHKMHLVPNGVMTSSIIPPTPNKKQTIRAMLGLKPGKIVAIFIGSSYKPNVEASEYIINYLSNNLPDIEFIIAGGVGEVFCGTELPENVIITGLLDDDRKIKYLQASDIAINPMFSGSGTNIKMFDFMAAGLPIISTRKGARGITDQSRSALIITDREDFLTALKVSLKNINLQELGLENRQWAEDSYAWEKISQKLGKLIVSKRPMSNKNQLRVAHLTTAGQKCGIGEYTLRFIENLPDNQVKHFIVTCQTPEKVFNLELMKEEFVIGWYFDNIKYHDSYIYPDSFEKICNWNADIVLIQYHHGFFSSDDLFYFSKKILTAGMKLFFVIHNYAKADIDLIKKLQSLNATFLSHSQREINTALTHGIKLLYIPMGIDVYEQIPVNRSIYDRNWEVTPPIIVNTGFLRMHKGLQSLIRAIALMQDRFPGTKLLLQCALYSSEDSHRTLAECKELIRKLELQWLVHIDDVFLPKSMIYENISKADIAVLPYTESDEGGSASAASCFAVGLPVVVSNAEIFSDIEEYTMKLPEATPEIIADFLVGLLDQPALYSEQVTKTNNYLHEASWGRVTKTLLSLILNPE